MKNISILIVEDEDKIRRALELCLTFAGYKLWLAEDGFKGLEMATSKKPSLILLDWMMPEMNGIEVLQKLKENRKTAQIPVFMLTAKSMVGDMDEAFEAGADDYITKPFEPDQLGTIISNKLERYKETHKAHSFFG